MWYKVCLSLGWKFTCLLSKKNRRGTVWYFGALICQHRHSSCAKFYIGRNFFYLMVPLYSVTFAYYNVWTMLHSAGQECDLDLPRSNDLQKTDEHWHSLQCYCFPLYEKSVTCKMVKCWRNCVWCVLLQCIALATLTVVDSFIVCYHRY